MRSFDELNISNSPYPPVHKEEIEQLESLIGLKLPYQYSTLLEQYNGGFPELNSYSNEEGEWDINNFFFLEPKHVKIEEQLESEGLLWNFNHKWDGAKVSILPFARDGGGNLFCLDLQLGENSPVIYWTFENPISDGYLLATSFESFINGLHLNEDYI